MRTQIKALTLFAVTLTAATASFAMNPPGPERSNRKQAGFNCPVCDSPCINKAALQRQLRQRRMQNQDGPRFQRNAQSGSNANPRWQRGRQNTSQQPQQRPRQQEKSRFDIDGDGRLSHAEKAARRAYRDAEDRNRGVQENGRPDPRSPAE